jgi:uncharacterized membrane protein YoaK (UPF0700 family)
MEQTKNIGWVTFLLATVAGYCDTVTFVAGDAIFSAHVTGNFIVFAAQTLFGTDQNAWVKLLTFPVFVIAVITGGWLIEKTGKKNHVLLFESILLLLAGMAAYLSIHYPAIHTKFSIYILVLVVVFAMGLQNAFGKLFAKETYGPTTMMTGNVTQAALDLGILLRRGFVPDVLINLKKDAVLILGFLGGCFLGAVLGKLVGLAAVILPGLAMLICYLSTAKKNTPV